jgi:MoxR-like ATPase
VEPFFTADDFLRMQALVRRVPVSRHVTDYAVSLARASRPKSPDADAYIKDFVEWGAGPRASQYLVLAGKVRALLNGRPSPSADDIRAVAMPIFGHRIIPNYNATGEGVGATQLVEHLLKTVKEPSYKGAGA